jgi:hypothetical protein
MVVVVVRSRGGASSGTHPSHTALATPLHPASHASELEEERDKLEELGEEHADAERETEEGRRALEVSGGWGAGGCAVRGAAAAATSPRHGKPQCLTYPRTHPHVTNHPLIPLARQLGHRADILNRETALQEQLLAAVDAADGDEAAAAEELRSWAVRA